MFDVILLAVDGSEHGWRAAKVAGELARAVNAKDLLIVVAFEPTPDYLGEPWLSEAISARTAQASQLLQRAEEIIGSLPLTPNKEVIEGSIAEAILDVAATRKCDLIVMGSRGLGRLEGALLGSNSQKVVSHAACPVLIVR